MRKKQNPAKFSIGDLVVTVSMDKSSAFERPPIGAEATVFEIEEYDDDNVYFFKEYQCGRFESELELSPVSKSPLWMALK